MKNQKGITMASLVIYIVSFAIIIGIVGSIITFFSNNVSGLNKTAATSVEYNKFNNYMLEYTKNGFIPFYESAKEYGGNPYIVFEKGDERVVFEKIGDILYMDNTKLCENVQDFNAKITTSENGKEMLKIKIQINGVLYSNDYIVE